MICVCVMRISRYAFEAAVGGTTPGRYDSMIQICLYFFFESGDFLRIDSQRRRVISKRSPYLSTSFCNDGNVSSKASPLTQSRAMKRYCLGYLRTIILKCGTDTGVMIPSALRCPYVLHILISVYISHYGRL